MLATINAIPFPGAASDEQNLSRMLNAMHEKFANRSVATKPVKMRHGSSNSKGSAEDPVLAPIPMSVPQLPAVLSDRPEVNVLIQIVWCKPVFSGHFRAP